MALFDRLKRKAEDISRGVWQPQKVAGVVAQVNPLDNGRTYKTVQQNGASFAPKAPASVIHQATHNGATNFAGQTVAPFTYLAKTDIVNPIRETAAVVSHNPVALRNATRQSNVDLGLGSQGRNIGSGARKFIGNTAQVGLTVAAPGVSNAIDRSFASVAPRVVPKIVPKVISNAGSGAVVGAPFSVASYVTNDEHPTVKGALHAGYQGAQIAAAGGAAAPLVGPIIKPISRSAAKATTQVAQKQTQAAGELLGIGKQNKPITPADLNILRDYVDYKTGSYRPVGAEANLLVKQARSIGQRTGVDVIRGSNEDIGKRVYGFIDKQKRVKAAQGGYVKIPGRNPDAPTNLYDDAEARVFAQNPLNPPDGQLPIQSGHIERRLSPQKEAESLSSSLPDRVSSQPLPEYNTKRVNNLDRAFRSTRSIIDRQGPEGQQLGGMLQGARDTQELYLGELEQAMPTVIKLAKKDRNRIRGGGDFENFVDATQGHAKPNNERVAQAVREWQATHPGIRDRAVAAGLDVGDLGPQYYPHFVDYDQIFKDTNTYNRAINHLVESGQAPTAEEAIKLLNNARDVSRNRSFGNLEASRLVDLPFYDKTPNSLTGYLGSAAKRIAQTETFGAKDEKALKLIADAGKGGADTEAMKDAYNVAVGAKQYNARADEASRKIRSYITTTRLGLGALTNVSQSVNTGIVTGHLRTLSAALKQVRPETKQFVADTGVISEALLSDLKSGQGYQSFTRKVLGRVANKATAPFFSSVEGFNRSVAATAGRDYALRLAQKGDEATLRRLGVTGPINGKMLTEKQQIQAARKIVEKTQFKVDAQDLPGWTDSPGGKLVSQFRTFSYAQGKFFGNEILKPALHKDFKPLARMMAALPVGYALYEGRRRIDGRPEEENNLKVGLQSFGKIGGAGLAFDLYQSLNPPGSQYLPSDRRFTMAAGTIGGPAVGVAGQAVGAVSELIQRKNTPKDTTRLDGKVALGVGDKYTDATPAARFGLSQVPIIGTPIKNRVLPYKKESDADTGKGSEVVSNSGKMDPKIMAQAFGKDFANLKDDNERKAWANLSPDNYAIYQNYTNAKNAYSKDTGLYNPDLTPELAESQLGLTGFDPQAALKKYDKLSTSARDKVFGRNNSAEFEYKAAQYLQDKVDGKLTDLEDMQRQDDLLKAAVGKNFDKQTRDLYGINKGNIYRYITTNPNGKALADKLLAYDDALVSSGLATNNKFRDKYGNVDFNTAKSGSKGGKSRMPQFASIASTQQPRSAGSYVKAAPVRKPQLRKTAVRKYAPRKARAVA